MDEKRRGSAYAGRTLLAMSFAAVDRLPSGPSVRTTVIGADPMTRRRIAELLRRAGFAAGASGRTLAVLLCSRSATKNTQEIKRLLRADADARVLAVVPADAPNSALRKLLLAGAQGIVIDGELEPALVPTARAMVAGQLAVPGRLARNLAPQPLSFREQEVLELVTLGLTNREIADRLYLAEST